MVQFYECHVIDGEDVCAGAQCLGRREERDVMKAADACDLCSRKPHQHVWQHLSQEGQYNLVQVAEPLPSTTQQRPLHNARHQACRRPHQVQRQSLLSRV